MRRIIEADESGSIRLAGEWLGSKPHARYVLQSEGDHLILRSAEGSEQRSIWDRLTPAQRAEDFLNWIKQQRPAEIHLTNEQLRRENMYD